MGNKKIIFNGDLVDRGDQGTKIVLLLCLDHLNPGSVFIIRGNYECAEMNGKSGFHYELNSKIGIAAFKTKMNNYHCCNRKQGYFHCTWWYSKGLGKIINCSNYRFNMLWSDPCINDSFTSSFTKQGLIKLDEQGIC